MDKGITMCFLNSDRDLCLAPKDRVNRDLYLSWSKMKQTVNGRNITAIFLSNHMINFSKKGIDL